MSRLILICLVLASVIVTSKHDVLAGFDARLNAALAQGRIWIGLETPATQTAEASLQADVTGVVTVQGQIDPQTGGAPQTEREPLVSIKPKAQSNLNGSATIRMLDSMTGNRENTGARFVKVAP